MASFLVIYTLRTQNFYEQYLLEMSWPENCTFCRIAAGLAPAEILYEDSEVVAFRDRYPQAPHHILVIPRRHIPRLHEVAASDAPLVGRLLMVAREVAQSLGLEKAGYRIVINNGAEAGQSIFHLHVHILGGRAMEWPPG